MKTPQTIPLIASLTDNRREKREENSSERIRFDTGTATTTAIPREDKAMMRAIRT